MYYGGPFEHAGNKKVSDMTGHDLTQAYESMRARARADAREEQRKRREAIQREEAEARRREWERTRMNQFIAAFGPEAGPAHYRNDLGLRNALRVVSTALFFVGIVTISLAYEAHDAGHLFRTILWSLATTTVGLGLAATGWKYPWRGPSPK